MNFPNLFADLRGLLPPETADRLLAPDALPGQAR